MSLLIKEKLYIGEASKSQDTRRCHSNLLSRRHNRRHHFRPGCSQPVQPFHVGQHRSNHSRALSNRLNCTSLRCRSRVAESLYVAALEEFVCAVGTGDDFWMGGQQRFHILAYTSLQLCIHYLYACLILRSRRFVLGPASLLRILFWRRRWWEKANLPNVFQAIFGICCQPSQEATTEWHSLSYISLYISFSMSTMRQELSRIGY